MFAVSLLVAIMQGEKRLASQCKPLMVNKLEFSCFEMQDDLE